MKKELKIVLIVLSLYILLVLITSNIYKEKVTYIDGNYSYDLKINGPIVTVNKYIIDEWKCITAPCPESRRFLIFAYTVPLTKHYKEIIDKEQLGHSSVYEIVEENEHSGVKERGYIIDKEKNEVSIYLGEKNTGGYEIRLIKAEVNQVNNALIEIEEVEPKEGDIVTQELTQPMLKIKFKQKINKVTISEKYSEPFEEIK